METDRKQVLFENRYDAGRQLAEKLQECKGRNTVVFAIPNGGVPVALEMARALDANLDLIIVRKIPLPLSPEGGFGAVVDDGTVILNDEEVKKSGLTQKQINDQTDKVIGEIRQRSLLYRKDRTPALVGGRTVIITDDGLASGYTMMAAVQSARRKRPKQIIVAVPVASAVAVERLSKVADKVVTIATGTMQKFYTADFYRVWRDFSDNEVIKGIDDLQTERMNAGIRTLLNR